MKFENFGYTCPNCETYYVVFDGREPVSEKKYNLLKRLTQEQIKKGYCKFCKRKDPKVPTTAEMDGLFTQEDMRNRNKVMLQCSNCNKWTQQTQGEEQVECHNCGSKAYDISSIKSLRSFNLQTDSRRKVKTKK